MMIRNLTHYLYCILSICVLSCSKEFDDSIIITQNDENAIISFELLRSDNRIVTDNDRLGVIDQKNRTIDFLFPFDTDITAVTPVITIPEGASITPASGIAQNFTIPVVYTVTAENGSELTYTATISLPEISERQALLNMYDSNVFEEEFRWNLEAEDIDDWYGVTAVDGKVTALFLKGDGGVNITSDIKNLINLERLSVFDTNLNVIEELGTLTSLKTLDFELAGISGGLQWIEKLVNLETLDFYKSSGRDELITLDFSNLKKLTTLRIRSNGLASVPNSINELTSLATLNLEENNITELPADLSGLANLEDLDLSVNNLTELPDDISRLTKLKSIRLSENNIVDISFIPQLTNLEFLSLNNNNITTIPADIENLTSLTTLSLNSNDITSIPTQIERLTNLKIINLNSNMIEILPSQIGNLINLETLFLNNNRISTIPFQIESLTNLTRLSISGNSISSIPSQIESLKNLTQFSMSSNILANIPPEIGSLTNLEILSLNNNLLTTIPEELGRLNQLETLSLQSNQLMFLPISVCALRTTGTKLTIDSEMLCN